MNSGGDMNLRLPLARRELARSARSKRTYALRLVVVGMPAVAIFFMWFATALSRSAPAPDSVGSFLAQMATVFQFGVVLLFVPLLTAGLIAQEKEDRTLGLLLIANLHGTDIFVAKFISAYIQAELLIISTLPILAFAALLGGVSVPAMALRVMLFSVWASSVCAVGLFWSTHSKRPATALSFTVLTLVAWTAMPVATRMLGPFVRLAGFAGLRVLESANIARAIWVADDPSLPTFYWVPSLAFCLAVTVAVSVATILLVPRQAYDRPRVQRRRTGPPAPAGRKLQLARLGPAGEIVERSATGFSSSIRSRRLKVIVALGLVPIALLTCFGPLFIMAMAAYDVISSIGTLRRSGLLDDLKLTVGNVTEGRKLAGQVFRANFNRCLFYLLAFVAAGRLMFFSFFLMGMTPADMPAFFLLENLLSSRLPLLVVSLSILSFLAWLLISAVAELWCVVAIASYCAMSKYSGARQAVAAVVYVLLMKWVAGVLAGLATGLFFVVFDIPALHWEAWIFASGELLFIAVYLLLGYSHFRRFRSKLAREVCLAQ